MIFPILKNFLSKLVWNLSIVVFYIFIVNRGNGYENLQSSLSYISWIFWGLTLLQNLAKYKKWLCVSYN